MKIENVIDISRTIAPSSVVYPGDNPIAIDTLCTIEPGCPCNISNLLWTTHFLTHVDPPLHFIKDGKSLDDIPLERFSGNCLVVEIEGNSVLPEHILTESITEGDNLLFKTRNSKIPSDARFDENHVYVSKEAADKIVEAKVNLVGIDYISIDQFGNEEYPVHNALLGADILILEGLDLSNATAGKYFLLALPLKIAQGDGSPVRAVLLPGQV